MNTITFPGSTISRSDLLARARDFKSPYPEALGDVNDRFVSSLEKVPGNTLGEIRANADAQASALYRTRLKVGIPGMGAALIGAGTSFGVVTGLLPAHPFAAIALAGLGATFVVTGIAGRIADREAAPRAVSAGVEKWGAYLAGQPQTQA